MTTILVSLDGSALADRAIPFAAAIAASGGWHLLLLRAVNTLSIPTETAERALKQEAQAALDAAATTLAADGLTVVTRVVDGQAETAILDAAADPDVELIVMSTHGRSGLGRFIYGSVADTVLRHAPVPVLTVPPQGRARWAPDERVKVMVPLDGSNVSRAALEPACKLADLLGGSLLLASVVTFPTYSAYAEGYVLVDPSPDDTILTETRHELEDLAATVRTDARPVEVCATYGTPYFGIMTIARDYGVGLIVMATHGRGGMARALLGSVATATVRQTDVPIVLVRPDMAQQAPASAPAGTEPSLMAPQAEAGPTLALELSPDQLELLVRIVGERLHNEAVDPHWAEPVRLLFEKLRMARPGPRDQEPAPRVPTGSAR